MAEDQEQSQKTEEPTQKRIEEAIRQGRVAFSREVNTFTLFLMMAIFISFLMPYTLRYGNSLLYTYISDAHLINVADANEAVGVLKRVIAHIAIIAAAPFLIALIASVLGNFLQNGFLIAPEALRFDLSRISIISGLQRLFSMSSVMEFVKSLFKVSCVSIAAYMAISQDIGLLVNIKQMSMSDSLTLALHCLNRLLIAVVVMMGIIATMDYIYQRHTYMQSLRMTKQEVKEELRQSEGNPEVRAKLKSIRSERSKKRMITMVPKADVVITNPTHYAVALQYEPQQMHAPKVVAKGIDTVALKIKEVALEHNIPVIENKVLARLLYETVKLDQFIQPEHYEAVARLIYNILKMKNKVK
ncbi:MAG: flagellar biosynthesis protein FlhB [Proteobacteria bacterium]|nr:flagellar biosynthesis protein FlhB [Pseudomonadota bacterium]